MNTQEWNFSLLVTYEDGGRLCTVCRQQGKQSWRANRTWCGSKGTVANVTWENDPFGQYSENEKRETFLSRAVVYKKCKLRAYPFQRNQWTKWLLVLE
jgi:hypothetical protein